MSVKNKKTAELIVISGLNIYLCSPYGNRTRVSSVKGTRPNP